MKYATLEFERPLEHDAGGRTKACGVRIPRTWTACPL